jgi:hypothetical protein
VIISPEYSTLPEKKKKKENLIPEDDGSTV